MVTTTIDKIVRAAIAEAGYKNLRKYILFLHFAFDGLYKLKRDNILVSFRYISLPVVNRVATIPTTVLAMGQLGWQRGQAIIGAVSGPNLSLDPAAVPGESGGFYQGIKYRIDRSVVPATVIFEEQPADGLVYAEVIDQVNTPTTETLIPHEGVIPMKSYIHFRSARFRLGAGSPETQLAEKEYLDEMDEAQAAMSDLTPQGIWFALSQKEVRSRLGLEYPFFVGLL